MTPPGSAVRDLLVCLADLGVSRGCLHAVRQAFHCAPDAVADDIGHIFDTVQGVLA